LRRQGSPRAPLRRRSSSLPKPTAFRDEGETYVRKLRQSRCAVHARDDADRPARQAVFAWIDLDEIVFIQPRIEAGQENAVTDAKESAPSFESDIKPLFRDSDRAAMLVIFDLWSFDDVRANASRILAAVREGSMPCDMPWSNEKVDLLQRWVDSDTPQ
jgi:hypothetical protein